MLHRPAASAAAELHALQQARQADSANSRQLAKALQAAGAKLQAAKTDALLSVLQSVPAAKADPFAEFASVFDKFASAEEVTGAIKAEGDEEPEDEDAADEDEPRAAPKPVRIDPADRLQPDCHSCWQIGAAEVTAAAAAESAHLCPSLLTTCCVC